MEINFTMDWRIIFSFFNSSLEFNIKYCLFLLITSDNKISLSNLDEVIDETTQILKILSSILISSKGQK